MFLKCNTLKDILLSPKMCVICEGLSCSLQRACFDYKVASSFPKYVLLMKNLCDTFCVDYFNGHASSDKGHSSGSPKTFLVTVRT